jgi:hypothetical protein
MMRSFTSCTPHQILVERSNKELNSALVVRMEERRHAYRVLVGKPDGKRQLRKT